MIDPTTLIREAEALEAMAARLRAMAAPVPSGPRVNVAPLESFMAQAFSTDESARVIRWTKEVEHRAGMLPDRCSPAEMARVVAPILATLPLARLREVLVKERPLREKEIDRVLAEMVTP